MFAIVKTGGKQYRVAKDDVIKVERLEGDEGDTISLDEVLLVSDGAKQTVGAPLVDGASVAAEVVAQIRDRKIIVFKKKRRQNYRRTRGHRQHLTILRVTDILTDGKKAPVKKAEAKKAEAPKADAKVEAKKAEAKPAAKKAEAKKTEAKKATAKKATAKKAAAKKPAAKK